MTPNRPRYQTLEELLKHAIPASHLAEHLDKVMLYLVLFINYEPEHIKPMIPCYESLYELRNLVLSQIKS